MKASGFSLIPPRFNVYTVKNTKKGAHALENLFGAAGPDQQHHKRAFLGDQPDKHCQESA